MNKITIPDRQSKQADSPSTPASQWLTGFGEYLLNIQGLTPGTHRDYCAVVSRFLDGFCGRAAPDWSLLRGEYLASFVRGEASRLRRHARETPAVAIRALLRYLRLIGAVRAGLEAAVPRTPRWRHAELPPSLSAVEVEHVLASVATDTRTGLRNRAILLLLARMGLRAIEVSQLALDDIDWRSSSLLIRKTKSRRDRRLPLAACRFRRMWAPRCASTYSADGGGAHREECSCGFCHRFPRFETLPQFARSLGAP